MVILLKTEATGVCRDSCGKRLAAEWKKNGTIHVYTVAEIAGEAKILEKAGIVRVRRRECAKKTPEAECLRQLLKLSYTIQRRVFNEWLEEDQCLNGANLCTFVYDSEKCERFSSDECRVCSDGAEIAADLDGESDERCLQSRCLSCTKSSCRSVPK